MNEATSEKGNTSSTLNGDGRSISIPPSKHQKLHGRAFYGSIGSPKFVLAPMVDQSEFAWRLLTRSFMSPSERKGLLAYTPMFHSRLFAENPKYRDEHFQPLKRKIPAPAPAESPSAPEINEEDWNRDGHPLTDRPLFVQFCSNNPSDFLAAAQHVFPFCDAVDLNLGCPQGIARRGNYGAFLQEDWNLIHGLISALHRELPVPVTAKFRIQEDKVKTLEYARMILSAGASIITVHGRRREQKGHFTGLADWSVIRYLKDNLPPETVIFANGNILQHGDIEHCLRETGADGVMSAEGNLCDPSVFAAPPSVGEEGREYWRGRDGKGGYRMDAVMRRYMDILYTHVLCQPLPSRKPLFLPSDPPEIADNTVNIETSSATDAAINGKRKHEEDAQQQLPNKKTRKGEKRERTADPNLKAMQGHLFHLLRPLVSKHHNVRDALARSRAGDMNAYENVLSLVEAAVKEGLLTYEGDPAAFEDENTQVTDSVDGTAKNEDTKPPSEAEAEDDPYESSVKTVAKCKRPWFVCQPYVRPLPKEAIQKGSITLSKKMKREMEMKEQHAKDKIKEEENLTRKVGLEPEGRVEEQNEGGEKVEVPREGVVCG